MRGTRAKAIRRAVGRMNLKTDWTPARVVDRWQFITTGMWAMYRHLKKLHRTKGLCTITNSL